MSSSRIDYGAWIDDQHIEMTRVQWLTTVRILFPGEIDQVKKEITKARREAAKAGVYHPRLNTGYFTDYVCAYFHLLTSTNRKWYYIQNYSKTTSVCHAVVKFCRKFGIDIEQFEDLKGWDNDAHSSLDPLWVPSLDDAQILVDELHDVNYHTLAALFNDALMELFDREEVPA